MSWTPDNPGAGDPGHLRTLSSRRTAEAQSVESALAEVKLAEDQARGSEWEGETHASFLSKIVTTHPDLHALAAGLHAQALALSSYAYSVETIQLQAARLTSLRADAEDKLNAIRYNAAVAESQQPSEYITESSQDFYKEEQRDFSRKAEDVEDTLTSLAREWEQLSEDRYHADQRAITALRSEIALGKTWVFNDSLVDVASDAAFLEKLSSLSPEDLRALMAGNPTITDRIANAEASEVAPWWNALPPAQRETLIASAPETIGNLGGVDYISRDVANRVYLDQAIKDAEEERTARAIAASPEDSRGGENLEFKNHLDALIETRKALGPSNTIPPRQLISLNASARPLPLAAVSVGNLDTASFASYQISGMNSGTNNMTDAVDNALGLQKEEEDFSNFLGIRGGHAVIAWIGYSSPDAVTVLSPEHARDGALLLADDLRDYRTRMPPGGFLAVNAHSYGSTAATIALSQPGVYVNAFAMYGSAGIVDAVTLADLHVPNGQTWVSEAHSDRLAPFGRYWSDRNDPRGWPEVERFSVDGGNVDLSSGEPLSRSEGHSAYLTRGSESLHNLAAINLGQQAEVTSNFAPCMPSPLQHPSMRWNR